MISDEPDEDADTVDDETLLETCMGAVLPKREANAGHVSDFQDFPQSYGVPNMSTEIDADIVAWFKANHADWQQQMGAVLRGWVVAHSRA
jgi:hypothetical protein